MGLWVYYFFAKFFLFAGGYIGFHIAENLAFALALTLPLKQRALRVARPLVAVPLGIALAYHDSWLPPAGRIFAQAGYMSAFSAAYMAELIGRFINPRVVLGILLLTALAALLGRRLRLSTFAVAGVLLVPLGVSLARFEWLPAREATAATAAAVGGTPRDPVAAGLEPATPERLDEMLRKFYAGEAGRRVSFAAPAAAAAPFDVMLLHICSLGWDDLDHVGRRDHALFADMDLQLRNYGSAASYSGPAAVRLMRSGCGHTSDEQLFRPAAPDCLLFNGLQRVGFEPQFAMNHDGHFGEFLNTIRNFGAFQAPLLPMDGIAVIQHGFDGSPVYDDYAMLERWWQQRLASSAPQVALFYNSMSLHDGNKVVGVKLDGAKDSYRYRYDRLASDLLRFMELVRSSGRRAVVVVVPEHGAALRGDRMQISGLREIPSRDIALVPAGVKLINPPQAPLNAPQRIEQPASLFGIGSLLAQLVRNSPFAGGAPDLAAYAATLPTTAFVAENEKTVVMRYGSAYWMRSPDGRWAPYLP